MRIAYLDCFAGISGDMFLGALLDAGVPRRVLDDAVAALALGASLRVETVDRSGISATKVHVLEGETLAEDAVALRPQPRQQHLHKTGHVHTHEHEHEHSHDNEHEPSQSHPHGHGRSLSVIRTLIAAAPLADPVKRTAIRAFELLGHSEAKIHNVPVEQIHFHEVGAVDAIVDIVAACAGIHHLQIGAWHCSPLNVGGGMVQCAHGNFPVPAPATADLLRGLPTYSAHVQKELVTPTGAALVRALAPSFGLQPAMTVQQIGYGAGTRNPDGFPNVLRLLIGESTQPAQAANPEEVGDHTSDRASDRASEEASEEASNRAGSTDRVTVLETALDDLSPQVLAYVAEAALTAGALDAMLTPVLMKKGRPGTLLTVLCHAAQQPALERLLLRETSTLGIRVRHEHRVLLERSHSSVATEFGAIRIKLGTHAGATLNLQPEFEDCRTAAHAHNVPVKTVQQTAIAAYLHAVRQPYDSSPAQSPAEPTVQERQSA